MTKTLQTDILKFLSDIADCDICNEQCGCDYDKVSYIDKTKETRPLAYRMCSCLPKDFKLSKDTDLRKVTCGYMRDRITAMRLIDRIKQEADE